MKIPGPNAPEDRASRRPEGGGTPPTSRSRILAAALLLAGVAFTPAAAADEYHPHGRTPLSQKEKRTFEGLMRDGKKLVDDERWLEAAATFSEAIKVDPHPEAYLWKGYAEEKLGHLMVAKAIYTEAGNEAKESKLPRFVEQAQEALTELSKKIPRIMVRVPGDVQASTTIDGVSIVPSAEGAEVNQGMRSVDVTAPGRKPFHVDVKAEEGKVYSLDIVLDRLPPPPSPPPPPPPPVEAHACAACAIGGTEGSYASIAMAMLGAALLGGRRSRRGCGDR